MQKQLKIIVCLSILMMTMGLSAKERVLCFGDSITYGTHINGKWTRHKSWVNLLQERSGGILETINEGRSGRRTSSMKEFRKVVQKYKNIDRVIFYLAVNDLRDSKERVLKKCVENMKELIGIAKKAYPEAKILILTSPGLSVKRVTPHFLAKGYNQAEQIMLLRLVGLYNNLAQKENCEYLDLTGVVSKEYYFDGLHPTTLGQIQTADAIWNYLVNKSAVTKVACVGDSITFGAGISDRTMTYPAQLQRILGHEFVVKNFGLNSRTLLKKGNFPYWREKAYKKALAFQPNYVIIKLGTNDSKPRNWKYKDDFATDLLEFANSFRNLKSRPKVYLAYPIPVQTDRWGITEAVVSKEIIPIIKKVAKENGFPIMNLYDAVPAKTYNYIGDGVHPNEKGAGLIAKKVADTLRGRDTAHDVHIAGIFSDNMVIQRNKKVPVWGWCYPNEKVELVFNGQKLQTVADKTGKWKVVLQPMKTGGPFEMIIDGKSSMVLRNIMIGEVWLCSGQSNMEMPVRGWPERHGQLVKDSKQTIANANFPNIRLFTVKRKVSLYPQANCKGNWQVCTPNTAKDFSATAFFFGRKISKELEGVPIGLIVSCWGGTPAESWTKAEALEKIPEMKGKLNYVKNYNTIYANLIKDYKLKFNDWKQKRRTKIKNIAKKPQKPKPLNSKNATVLYNGMIAPLLPFAIRGVIWYQGEANSSHPRLYLKIFPAMVKSWREDFIQGQFPFYYVQIAPYRYRNKEGGVMIREVQRLCLDIIPNSGMVCIMDSSSLRCVHPPQKKDAGERLAFWALTKTYGKQMVYSGPLYKRQKIDGNKVVLSFSHCGSGLDSKGKPLTGFQVCGKDGKFYTAHAIIDGNCVVVTSEKVAIPVAVKYCWKNDILGSLFNKEGLPASSFRTDKL